MIVCKDYGNFYTVIEDDTTLYYFFVNLTCNDVPSQFPVNAVGIENFPQNYPLADVRFACGSTLYCVNDGSLYMVNDEGEFIKQPASGGGGGPSVPTPSVADNGKILGVSGGSYALLDDVRTYRPFNNSWVTDTTTSAFCASVNSDAKATAGMAYLGELTCSDLPFNGNADAVVEIVDGTGTSGKVIHIVITSGNVAPYRWEYTYWNDGSNISGWISFATPIRFTNVAVSSWVSDSTYADYAYRASVVLSGVTANSYAQVTFSVVDALSGKYAPIAETYNGGIYLYSTGDDAITVPTIYVLN